MSVLESSDRFRLNPNASARILTFEAGQRCIVIDDVLLDPDAWVEYATEQVTTFGSLDHTYYPGEGLAAPPELIVRLRDLYINHALRQFDARRCLHMLIRFAMVTKPPAELRPLQWFCHRDGGLLDHRYSMVASVLYLFRDLVLGGTSFYVPNRPEAEIESMMTDAASLPPEEFSSRYGVVPRYQTGSDAYFRRVGGVEARFNRAIFYDGLMMHSGDIARPELLTADPRTGRLTINGFFTCRRHLA